MISDCQDMDKKPLTRPVRKRIDFMAVGVLTIVSFAANALPRDLSMIVLVGLTLLVLTFHRITLQFLMAVWPLLIILLLGLSGLQSHDLLNITRDFIFALTPVALIFLGFWLAERKGFWDQLPLVLVSLGLIFAIKHLSAYAVTPSLLLMDPIAARAIVGPSYNITVLSFLVLLFINRFTPHRKPLNRFVYGLAFSILFASVLLSYSRTSLIVVVLGFMGAKGWLIGRNLKLILLIIVACLMYLLEAGDGNVGGGVTFMSKLTRSLTELAVSDYETLEDISLNWRGYESYKTLEQYLSGNMLQLVIGQGYGATVDLGFYMPLGGDASIAFRYIPVLHSGYGYVLLKYGVAGMLMYLVFYVKLIRIVLYNQNSISSQIVFCSHFLLGLTLSLAFVMFVGGGMAQLTNIEFVVVAGVMVSRLLKESGRVRIRRT